MSRRWFLVFKEVTMFVRIDHVHLVVKNLKESIHWYQNIFGFELVESGQTDAGADWGVLAHNDSMICLSEAKAPFSEGPLHSGIRVAHFGLRVTDRMRWVRTIEEHRLQLFYGGLVQYPFSQSWYIQDPTGHEIEVSYSDGLALQFPK